MLRLIRHLIFFFAAAGFSACAAVEESKYEPGPNNGKAPSSDPAANTEPGASAFGLTDCVGTYMTEAKLPSAIPPILSTNLSTFAAKNSLDNLSELTDLTDLLLRDVVTPGVGLVNYTKLKADHAGLWSLLLSGLKVLPAPDTDDSVKIAFWTNAYNIIMMNFVLEKSLTTVSTNFEIFDEKVAVAGQSLSLNQIEKGILRLAGGTVEHPVELTVGITETRLHFALVCAALSCPKLRNFAYRPDILDNILTENKLMFFNSDLHVTSTGGIKVSNLFSWFADDFDTMASGTDGLSHRNLIETSVVSQCRSDGPDLASEFEAKPFKDLTPIIYDWTVNLQK